MHTHMRLKPTDLLLQAEQKERGPQAVGEVQARRQCNIL